MASYSRPRSLKIPHSRESPLDMPLTRPIGLVLMVLAPVLWSTAGVVTRHVERATSFELVFWRSLFAFLFVAAALLAMRRSPLTMGRPGLISGALWGVMFTAFMIALTFTSTANT